MLRAAGAPASSGRAGARPTTPRRSSVWRVCAPGWRQRGRWGWVRSFRWRKRPSWPSHPRCGSHHPIEDLLSVPGLRSPPEDGENIPVAWRTTQSSIGKHVLDGDVGEDNTTGRRAGREETPPAHRPVSQAARAASARRVLALRGARSSTWVPDGVATTDGVTGPPRGHGAATGCSGADLHLGPATRAAGATAPSRTYFWHQDCALPQMTAGRSQ